MADLVRVTPIDDGAFWRITFGAAKGNILDRATVAALNLAVFDAASTAGVRGICLEGAGAHFSFGASVREHMPDQVEGMLADLGRLVLQILDSHLVFVAAIRGQCLGGGLELASVCHRLVAHTDARVGQPEIALGVFAPVASLVLPDRIGRARAEDLCLTGRTIPATEAAAIGLIDEVIDADPGDHALAWLRAHFASRSAVGLRFAVQAIRSSLASRLRAELPALETLYLRELMATHDALEGLQAFLDKRPPVWRHA
jgi:cyclohexa-1,5-dienecarbonyl-CoA hydratase